MQYVIFTHDRAFSSLNIQVNISHTNVIYKIIKLHLSKLQHWSSTLQCLSLTLQYWSLTLQCLFLVLQDCKLTLQCFFLKLQR